MNPNFKLNMENIMTIKELSALWKADKQQYVKRSTLSAYTIILENHILPAFGDKCQLMESEIQEFALGKLQSGLTQKTVKDMLIVLKMVMKFGSRTGLLPAVDWHVRYPTDQKKHELEILSVTHFQILLQYVRDNFSFRNLGIFICLTTGMRIGEVCALKWSDIDLINETISVNRTIERIYLIKDNERRTELVIDTPKSRNSIRIIPISKELMKLVRPLKKMVNENNYILSNELRPSEPRTYRNYFKLLLKRLGIPDIKFHGLRHSFATRCIEAHCDYKTLSAILGHSNITTTLNLYVHPNLDQKKKCINEMMKSLYKK